MDTKDTKITANRQKKINLVVNLNEKFTKAKAVVFTNYQGLTHKQIEELKKAIKPLEADYVVAKNSLVARSLDQNDIKLEGDHLLSGPTGTLFLYNDIITPLKALAKMIKELNIPTIKFGIMEKDFITGEQVMKLSTLPSREILLTQIAVALKSPISGLHRALSWNIQKLVMTLNAVAATKPALATAAPVSTPIADAVVAEPVSEPTVADTPTQEPEPETIPAETPDPISAPASGEPANPAPIQEANPEEIKSEGGEN